MGRSFLPYDLSISTSALALTRLFVSGPCTDELLHLHYVTPEYPDSTTQTNFEEDGTECRLKIRSQDAITSTATFHCYSHVVARQRY